MCEPLKAYLTYLRIALVFLKKRHIWTNVDRFLRLFHVFTFNTYFKLTRFPRLLTYTLVILYELRLNTFYWTVKSPHFKIAWHKTQLLKRDWKTDGWKWLSFGATWLFRKNRGEITCQLRHTILLTSWCADRRALSYDSPEALLVLWKTHSNAYK